MTDKQMIHNVDVSECKKYEHEIIRCNTSLKNMCFYGGRCTDERNVDCYYKQLKHKEQELQEAMDNYVKLDNQRVKEYNELVNRYTDKEKECKELKREIDIRSCANIELSLEFKKYKKAIDEIEEIADNNYENPEMERIFKIIGGLDV